MAVYLSEPYAHMLPIGRVFGNIKGFLAANGITENEVAVSTTATAFDASQRVELIEITESLVNLFQSACLHYKELEAGSTTRNARLPGKEDEGLPDFYDDLNFELASLHSFLELLIDNLHNPSAKFQVLTDFHTQSLATRYSLVAQKIHSRLGTGYQVFTKNLTYVLQQLAKLVHSGIFDPPMDQNGMGYQMGIPPKLLALFEESRNGGSFSSLRSRFKFGINADKQRQILDVLAGCNLELLKLLHVDNTKSLPKFSATTSSPTRTTFSTTGSGLEVIGVVFAIIPIFETAAPITHKAVDHVKTAFSPEKAASKLRDLCENLHFELSMLQMALRNLVRELDGLTEEEKQVLMTGSGSKLWSTFTVVRAVEDRLGAGAKTFQIYLIKLLHQLNKLVLKENHIFLLPIVT
jgi:hypothetical protein